jgi:hypothetical protein
MSVEPEFNLPTGLTFGALLKILLEKGTRPPESDKQGEEWAFRDFYEAVGVSDRQFRNWIANKSLPPDTNTIARILLGRNKKHRAALRKELNDALERTRTGEILPTPESSPRFSRKWEGLLRQMLERNFRSSQIPSPMKMREALGRILRTPSIKDLNARASAERMPIYYERHPIISSSHDFGKASDHAIRCIRNRCEKCGFIKVISVAVQPAVISALFHIRTLIGGAYVAIDHSPLNGPNAATSMFIEQESSFGKMFDISIMPAPAFYRAQILGKRLYLERSYQPIMAVHDRVIGVAYKAGQLKRLEKIRLLNESSSEDVFHYLQSGDLTVNPKRFDERDYRSILKNIEPNEAVIVGDPEFDFAISEAGYCTQDRFVQSFGVWMFLKAELANDREFIRAWSEIFVSAWTYCRENRHEALNYLKQEGQFVKHFQKGTSLAKEI